MTPEQFRARLDRFDAARDRVMRGLLVAVCVWMLAVVAIKQPQVLIDARLSRPAAVVAVLAVIDVGISWLHRRR